MINIQKQIAHWEAGAQRSWEAARLLVEAGHTDLGLFSAHLALEKALKALVCKHTGDLAPKMHNLPRLAELAGLCPTQEQKRVFQAMNRFVVEGRYPRSTTPPITVASGRTYLARAEEVFRWLMSQL